ncbi:hypothetical protein Q5Y75_04695 [Ruegeria sp. 2205SS24-7]|uniref:hypothetical protein n=1 Tax=Ruegeria discodermiae TaxID=3064389 RepID=UPI002741D3F3|nr:hypothetical protein [Ruegeria sp. 2205SS24-7]MDP5216506.1 hypothetical protein [Ruegeria sp. 2205SS24-7]
MQDEADRPNVVTPEFMARYDHLTPSGHMHPACKLNRLANIGLDCRAEVSPQIDLNLLTDRSYTHLCETSDDGWLIGGGDNTKLERPDTAHAEIWRFGPDNKADGGLPFDYVEAVMRAIKFAPIRVIPSRVNLTPSNELELLLEYDPGSVIGQLLGIFSTALACPCGDYGNPFHITLVRGVKFRSDAAQAAYFSEMESVVAQWRSDHPEGVMFNDGGIDLFANREKILAHVSPSLSSGVEADIAALREI